MHPLASVPVLSVSDHDSLRSSRELLLESVGLSVISMSSDCALQSEIPRDLAVAILGYTVDDLSASRIAAELRRSQPGIRILRITMQYSRCGTGFDGFCFVEDGPEAFLSCVAELVTPEMMDEVAMPFLVRTRTSLAYCH